MDIKARWEARRKLEREQDLCEDLVEVTNDKDLIFHAGRRFHEIHYELEDLK